MSVEDQEKTTLVTEKGLYCYKVMPFGLKNAGAIYQRLVNKMYKEQLGKTMEVYIDDMVIKSRKKGDYVTDFAETFQVLNKYQMKLNPTQCAFEVSS